MKKKIIATIIVNNIVQCKSGRCIFGPIVISTRFSTQCSTLRYLCEEAVRNKSHCIVWYFNVSAQSPIFLKVVIVLVMRAPRVLFLHNNVVVIENNTKPSRWTIRCALPRICNGSACCYIRIINHANAQICVWTRWKLIRNTRNFLPINGCLVKIIIAANCEFATCTRMNDSSLPNF